MDYKNADFKGEMSQAWRASLETQGTITILDPSIFD